MRRPLPAVPVVLALAFAQAPGAEERTPAQWLDWVRTETARQKTEESPERKQFLESAGRAMHPYAGGPEALLTAPPDRRRQFQPFASWLEGVGAPLFRTWRAGESLTDAECALEPVLQGVLLHRYRAVRRKVRSKAPLTAEDQDALAYGQRVEERGQALLRKGYLGGSFARSELDELRLYAMWIDIRCTGDGVLPFHLGLSEDNRARKPPALGSLAPDATLLQFDAPLRSPACRDANPADPSDLLRPAVLTEFLQLMQGYEPDPGAPDQRVRAKPVAFPDARRDEVVRLSDFRGKKPVLLVLADPTDLWAWHWRLAPMLEPVHQAYRRHIAFFFVATTVHDTHMPVMDFLDPTPTRRDSVHPVALEHRARNCKMFYMDLPHCTVPYLLDDLAQRTRNAYRDQGGGAYFVLIDLDGRVAYADYHQQVPPHWGPKAVNFPYEFTTIRLNHLESRLRAFVDGGCRHGKHMDTPLPDWRLGRGRADDDVVTAHRQPTIWLAGRIAAVDASRRILTVERHRPDPAEMPGLRFWNEAGIAPFDAGTKSRLETVRKWVAAGDGERTYRFAVGETIDVFLDGRAVALPDLRAGDQIGIWYRTAHESHPRVPALQVRAYRVAQ